MPTAQDEAFALLARARGLIGEGALAAASAGAGPLAQRLIASRALSADAGAALLRELGGARFACPQCRQSAGWDALAGLAALACPRCRVALVIEAKEPASGARPAVSGAQTATLPAGSWPGPLGSASGPRPLGSASGPGPLGSASGRGPALRTIGPYQLLQELGRGANGVVFLALDPTGRQVAVKSLLAGDLADEETEARFKLEAFVGLKVEDPGVVRVLDVGRDGERLYYAMEYCPGQTLQTRLRQGRLAPAEAARLVAQVARSIHVAHEMGVIHRDLKPANILLDAAQGGRPRVSDFGLARDRSFLRTMTRTGDILGSPYYMAPEQFRGETSLDHRVDVYALGVILYECLTGERPFAAATPMLLAERVLHGSPEPPSALVDLPAGLEVVCLRAMARAADARYPDAAALADDLERVLAGEPPRAAAPSVLRRAALGAGIGVALSALLVVGALAVRGALASVEPVAEVARAEAPRAPLSDPEAARALLERVRTARAAGEELGPLAGELERARSLAGDDAALAQELAAEARAVEVARRLREVALAARGGASFAQLAPALEAAAQAAQEEPALARPVAFEGAALRVRRGRSAEALSSLDALAEGDDELAARAALWAGVARERLGKLSEARGTYAALGARAGASVYGRLARAALARLDGRAAAAGDEAAAALRAAPDQPLALVERGVAALAAGAIDEAEVAFQRAGELLPDAPGLAEGIATLRLREGKPAAAERVLAQALALLEQDPAVEARVLLGLAALAQEKHGEARAALAAAVERDPTHIAARVHRGVALLRVGTREEVAADWGAAHRADARAARRELARWHDAETARTFEAVVGELELAGRVDGAAAPLGALPPTLAANLDARVLAFPSAVRPDLLDVLRRAARGEPLEEFAFALRSAVRFAERDPALRLEQLRLLLGRDALEPAREALREVRALPGLDDAARRELDRLEAELAWRAGELALALRGFDALALRDRGGLQGSLAAAQAALLRAEYATARSAAGLAAEIEPGAATPRVLLGLALLGEGRAGEALDALAVAFAVEGARDSRLLAGRAVGFALLPERRPVERDPLRQALRVVDPDPVSELRASEGTFAPALAAWLALEQEPPLEELALAALRLADGGPRADAAWVRGLGALRVGQPREDVDARWREARALQAGLPLPRRWVERYRERFGAAPPLDE